MFPYAVRPVERRRFTQVPDHQGTIMLTTQTFNLWPSSCKGKGRFLYSACIRWTIQSAYTSPPGRPIHSGTNWTCQEAFLSHTAIMREDYSLIFPPPSIASYSFIQLSELGRRGENTNALRNGSKRGFEPGLSRLRVRYSTAELPPSTKHSYPPLIYHSRCFLGDASTCEHHA